jgi:hypothetical protein
MRSDNTDDLTTNEQNFRAMMNDFAVGIGMRLPEDIHFALVIYDADEIGGYVGSGERSEAAAALKETARRLETGEKWQRPRRG